MTARRTATEELILALAAGTEPESALTERLRRWLGLARLEVRPAADAPAASGVAVAPLPADEVVLAGGDADDLPVRAGVAARVLHAARLRAEEIERLRRETDEARGELMRRRRAEESKDRFISSVSHEFRTPLTSIRSFAEILLSHGPEDEATTREFLSIIHEESVRLSRLVNGLLDLSKMQAGRMDWEFAENDLSEAVRRASRSVGSLAGKREVSVEFDAPERPLRIVFDRDKVIQVLVNLLSNAIKYSPDGASVTVTLRPDGEGARVAVRDRGPGIPEIDRARVFERFSRVGDHRSDVPGTGLGLSISREIVLAHGGRISVDAAPEGGSVFSFTLPPRAGAGTTTPAEDEPEAAPGKGLRGGGRRILLVEDDPNFRRFLRFELGGAGFDVEEAESGLAGLRRIREAPPDLVILDLNLPDLSGGDVLTLLRADPDAAGPPVLVLSVDPPDLLRRDIPDAVLRKPVDGRRLFEEVGRLLSRTAAPA